MENPYKYSTTDSGKVNIQNDNDMKRKEVLKWNTNSHTLTVYTPSKFSSSIASCQFSVGVSVKSVSSLCKYWVHLVVWPLPLLNCKTLHHSIFPIPATNGFTHLKRLSATLGWTSLTFCLKYQLFMSKTKKCRYCCRYAMCSPCFWNRLL